MDPLDFEVVTISDARKALDGEQKRHGEVARGSDVSGPEGALLLDSTIRWMAGLPADVRPLRLAKQFPRVANGIAELWPRVARCDAYLRSLVVDRRGVRRELPSDVALELTALRSHYASLHAGERPR